MNKLQKVLLSLVCITILTICTVFSSHIITSRHKLDSLNQQLYESTLRWKKTDENKTILQKQLKELQNELREIELTLSESEKRSEELKQEISVLEKEIEVLESDLER